ncbi:TauD/TfdA family dioxygenase [Allorhodopirellula solitaria]|uniref:Taurine catabolism dioxygenase TauD, TfdA family n=1 Tax=Allorhodopirellula solitaria TaxID=2527987 RepID=A0A5C5XRB8_9BACT|nr:TauD/TfdA family dioxygenase [Allorhodopirellula solitaria]TWT65051.1 Taurine catabolism dioxygenase TauD, TfdA family [Allorhodopirellula solitaria]
MEFLTEIKLRTADPMEASEIARKALEGSKVVKVVPEWYLGDLRAFYDVFTDNIGVAQNIGEDFTKGGAQTGEKWLEIRYDADIPDVSAYRHSKNAQPLHTDESYIPDPADIMVFYSVNKALKGGATTFVDGPVLVKYLQENASELLERLTTAPVTYRKSEQARTEKIIDIKPDGSIHFNFNYYCIDKNETEPNKTLNQNFFDFLQSYVAHSHMIEKVTLNPGEAVLWWDELVLHGRTSYEVEKTDDRFIWKTGFKWKA